MKIACVRCEKIHPSLATRKKCIRVPKCTRFASFFVPEPMLKNTPKHVLGYNYEDCMRSLRKNPPESRYTEKVHSAAEMHPFCIIFRSGTDAQKHSQTCSRV